MKADGSNTLYKSQNAKLHVTRRRTKSGVFFDALIRKMGEDKKMPQLPNLTR
jgi:hypothetical protein